MLKKRSLGLLSALLITIGAVKQPAAAADTDSVFARDNLVAWCIVPFDAKHRGPQERAEMLNELGIKRCAYDWRAEHVPSFEQEILEYRKHGIEFFAFWSEHEAAFKLFEKYGLHPQIWQTLESPSGTTDELKVETAANHLLPLVQRTAAMGCKLGLYNHGGWGGEPKNIVAVCKRLHALGHPHVGIVYNFHHGHGHIQDWPEAFEMLKPFLLCLNLNGMNASEQPKILGIGKGTHEVDMLRTVVASDYAGPIGIIGHRETLDAREALQENLDGLASVAKDLANLGDGLESNDNASLPDKRHRVTGQDLVEPPYSAATVSKLIAETSQNGDMIRGAKVFADAKYACLSCHRVGQLGGAVGPELFATAPQRDLNHIVESVLWPKRDVKPEYVVWRVLTSEGRVFTGYRHAFVDGTLTLRDPSSNLLTDIETDNIEEEVAGSTVMPSGLTAGMSAQQRWDLIRFLHELQLSNGKIPAGVEAAISSAQSHEPAVFPLNPEPIDPARWSNSTHLVNRGRLYDFYIKQAEYFRQQKSTPTLLGAFPGLDGGKVGHWGNQTEKVWADDRWNDTQLGSLQCGVFHADELTVARGVCVRIGDHGEMATCFNPDTLTYESFWTDGFVGFSSVRHGFMNGLQREGRAVDVAKASSPEKPSKYHGFYRSGNRVVFAYRIGDVEFLDSPWVKDGVFTREVAPANEHPLRGIMSGGPAQWPEVIETPITLGAGRPYAVDTIALPYDNPWKALVFCGDHDFLSDGSALVCTMQGDVWHVSGLSSSSDSNAATPRVARWRRFASGLHQPLGLVVVDDKAYVQCRDQLMRLADLNHDGEADFYECFCNAFQTSTAGHDFICGLQRDNQGNFYTASGNQGLVRISSDGERADVMATGFRNPDGLGLLPGGVVTVPCSEGDWTPASMICAVDVAGIADNNTNLASPSQVRSAAPPHYGYQGPRNQAPPSLPLAYLPRGLDNSSGGQAFVDSDLFGPLRDQSLHFSFGAGAWFAVLRDEVNGQMQGAVVPLAGDFLSGVHRGRFHPIDGQLYVSGMAGWGSYTGDDGCFQRVRYTRDAAQLPIGFHVHENGIRVTFSSPLDLSTAAQTTSHFAQCWNFRYSGAYGSPEFSTAHVGIPGHDPLMIKSATVLADGRSMFLEIPDLQPCNQLHLRMHVNEDEKLGCSPAGTGHDLFVTVHELDQPFTQLPNYRPTQKLVAAHPLLVDLAMNANRVPNPWRDKIAGARQIEIATGKNLTFATREFEVKANEKIAFTLKNPDVVPHNWVLVQSGALQHVGELANQLIADPNGFARQYVPKSEAVLVYSDIVLPGDSQTIFFSAPATAGTYPFLCSFPGHWMVMNGSMIVK